MEALLVAAVVGPASLTAGVFIGAHIHHRASRQLSPIPDIGGAVKGVIAAIRKKPEQPPKEQRIRMPRMNA